MGSAFHQLCPRYSGTLTPTAPTANRLWETFTLTKVPYAKKEQRTDNERSILINSEFVLEMLSFVCLLLKKIVKKLKEQ